MNSICTHCGALHFVDERLTKSSKRSPQYSVCCLQGQISLPLPSLPPQPLRDLLNGADPRSRAFREKIRRYNAAFAFTSSGARLDNTRLAGTEGPYSFMMHGAVYHQMGSLLPNGDEAPIYAQLYIYDDQQAALDARSANNDHELNRGVMAELQGMFMEHNPLVPLYRAAHEWFMRQPAEQRNDLIARIVLEPTADGRRYNLPTASEVAAIIPGSGENEAVDKHRQIAIRLQSGDLQFISHLNPLYAPLHYVLLFPRGQQGWHINIPSLQGANGTRRAEHVSQRCYYSYVLHPRIIQGSEVDYLFRAGRLLQEYMVDAWASVEASSLAWIQFHQKDIRADLYQGLLDAVNASDEGVNLGEQGQRIILPSTHPGSSRHMYQLFQDSMAICRRFRKPDIFLTMTANPNWPKVQAALLDLAGGDHARKQDAADRPDIVARVFHLKKQALLKVIKDGFFGELAADVYTIEFQKRGLPHMHLLIFLREPYKIKD
ncbi:hypothetical protein OH76DRAFT_1330930, partial [Lentinus brumalis]